MHRIITILLLALGIFHFGKNVAIMATYAVDYEYISQVLCINKDKPKSKCNGKCHLAKQLKKAEPIQSEQSNTTLVSQVQFLFYFMSEVDKENNYEQDNERQTFVEFDQNTLEYFAEVPVPPPSIS